MQIWAGLGNPGPQYAMHRHNVGFMAVDALADRYDAPAPAKKFQGWVQEVRIGGDKIILLKPATYMNESGRSIRAAMSSGAPSWAALSLATSAAPSQP